MIYGVVKSIKQVTISSEKKEIFQQACLWYESIYLLLLCLSKAVIIHPVLSLFISIYIQVIINTITSSHKLRYLGQGSKCHVCHSILSRNNAGKGIMPPYILLGMLFSAFISLHEALKQTNTGQVHKSIQICWELYSWRTAFMSFYSTTRNAIFGLPLVQWYPKLEWKDSFLTNV